MQEISPKKNRYLWLVTVFMIANYVLNANHHPAPLWKGMIIPIIIMMMFAILDCVHVVINPHFRDFLTASHSIVKNIL